ncbi:unnamed protein product, partial [marine sediment metagenome]
MKKIKDASKIRIIAEKPKDIAQDIEKIKNSIKNIVEDIRTKKDAALIRYTKEYDNVDIQEIKVSETEIDKQSKKVSKEFLDAISVAKTNIEKFHNACMPKDEVKLTSDQGIELGQLIVPF